MYTKPFLTVLLILFLASCSKENDIEINEGYETLSKIEIYEPTTNTLSTSEYKYDNAGRLTEIAYKGSDASGSRVFRYDASGKIMSYTVSNSTSGIQYSREFQVDGAGRIIKAKLTTSLPNFLVINNTYTYDAKGRLIIDSSFTQNGNWYSYAKFEYDNNDNVITTQDFVNQGIAIYSQGPTSIQYDSKRSPFHEIGQFLYTTEGGNGDMYFYLSKSNPLKATRNNIVLTPGGGFNNTYYNNALLRVKSANIPNALRQIFYYAP